MSTCSISMHAIVDGRRKLAVERNVPMTFQTRRFGRIEIPEEKVLRFNGGIPGLECMKRSILIKVEETMPFYWLQSLEDGDFSLPVISPLVIDAAYSPSVEDDALEELELDRDEDLLIVAVAVIPKDVTKMTANMAAPLLINIQKNIGRQVILDNPAWQMRQPIYDAVCRKLKEENERAGIDSKDQ
jgi:flagellar assembly factor FliW